MMRAHRHYGWRCMASLCLGCATVQSLAQPHPPQRLANGYPSKSIRIIVSSEPGGSEAVAPNRPDQFRNLIASEIVKWERVIQKLGLKK